MPIAYVENDRINIRRKNWDLLYIYILLIYSDYETK